MAKASDTTQTDDVKIRAEIDRSARFPVLFFLTSAVFWLVVGTLLALIASIKLRLPGFLDADWLYWLNYGRLKPAFMGALVYGWALQAGLAVSIWIMARLCRAEIRNPITLIIAGHFWNVGVVIGVLGIFFGEGTGAAWMEFPVFVWPILFIAHSLVVIWILTLFQRRTVSEMYISQWYILGACFWFPWIYLTANVFIHLIPGAAVMSTAINMWFVNAIIYLVLAPVGLASAYYFVPKVLGRPIHSYQLALVGFWGLAILGGWTGMQRLIAGPIPAWMQGVSGAAMILMLIPVIAVSVNLHLTTRGRHDAIQHSPTVRFIFFGSLSFTIMCGLGALYCFAPVNRFTQLTHAIAGYEMMAIYAFFTMSMFGAMYFMVPRLVGCEWRSPKMINFHFWMSTYGTVALVACLVMAGLSQASGASDWEAGPVDMVKFANQLVVGTVLAWSFLLLANIAFLAHLTLMICRRGRVGDEPTLILSHHPAAPIPAYKQT